MNKKFKTPPEYSWDTFRERFAKLMESYALNGVRMAEKIQISTTCVSRYLSGATTPDILALWRIADAFDVSIDWLVGRNQTGDLTDQETDLLNKYSLASQNDKAVIATLLQKYE